MPLVTIDDVRAAAAAIAPAVVRTPLLRLDTPGSALTGLWVKPENLQPTGAFKLRGAANALSRLAPAQRRRGVVTHSSGNHAFALAYAGRRLGVPVVAVMPDTATEVKLAAVAALGAEVRLVDPDQREECTARLAADRGLAVVPPFDHVDVIAGQGTVALEILADLPDVETVLVPVGGGGLASGVAATAAALRPAVRVVGVEPALAADAAESLRAGELRRWPVDQRGRTCADGLRTGLSELTFAHLRAYLHDVVTVAGEEIAAAVRLLAGAARVVAEPSGAVAAAGYAFARDRLPGGRTVAVVSGGNIAPAALAALLAAGGG